MALLDELTNINNVLTFMERIKNLAGTGMISGIMYSEMHKKCIAYLENLFPPPPPPEP